MVPVDRLLAADIEIGNLPSQSTNEPAEGKAIWSAVRILEELRRAGRRKRRDLQIDKVDAGQGRDEHPKRHEDRDEDAGRVHKPPRLDDVANEAHDEGSAGNIDPSGRQGREIHAAGYRVLDQVDGDLAGEESNAGKEGPCAGGRIVAVALEEVEQSDWVPDGRAVHVGDGAGGCDAQDGTDSGRYDPSHALIPDNCSPAFGEACPVSLSNACACPRAGYGTDGLQNEERPCAA